MKLILFSLLFLNVVVTGNSINPDFERLVTEAIERQMSTYPESTLKDLYKNFFQDKYGPGHIIEDTTSAGNYLRRELSEMKHSSGEDLEPTGWEGNFYRVNLTLIKNGKIPYDIFFNAFVSSVNSIKPVPVSDWEKEWVEIEKIILRIQPDLPDYQEDKRDIMERFSRDEYVGHHSEQFEASYSPHYRIISREKVEQLKIQGYL